MLSPTPNHTARLCSHNGSLFVKFFAFTTDCFALRSAGLSKTCSCTATNAALQQAKLRTSVLTPAIMHPDFTKPR